jgi:hypothetical protein
VQVPFVPAGVSECKRDRYVCACRCFRVQVPFMPAQVFQSASKTDTFVPAGVSECKRDQ